MSSTNKTSLGLNSWIGSDKPQRIDFNCDNEIIDNAITSHTGDSVIHITEQERELWNSSVFMGIYYGNGVAEREIRLDCDFEPSFAIIYARNRPFSVIDFQHSVNRNYAALISRLSGSMGAGFSNDLKSLVVMQSPTALIGNENANLNESGVAYTYVVFR